MTSPQPATPATGDGALAPCHCVIKHAITDDERAELQLNLEYARSIGDMGPVPLLIESLTGRCPAREGRGAGT